ncbi:MULTISPECIES: endopeptidase La [Acidobacterium]|uniref:Lon protease n=1 Tax=Acidobacterium capsulatum (strain ATCC 51196 / DSM 11244 / BCRC 80197 / JCM 7670 / NBRC 15755 / NCIMB 13165 / 161) TaxID=240015 RepID=C1F1K8_ACIC5|nr:MULTISPECIES: endopeptidase La [Acidobacterium]ACO33671.1 endopeptidase LA [Acidobacterium capsulatum ATCC 51196]HCT61370.1 endopeptidase La [Acidobacterium sp.]
MSSDFLSVIHPSDPNSREPRQPGRVLPVLPVRDTVLFPHAVLPLTVGRESSIQLIQSLGDEKTIVVVAQRDAHMDAPQPADLYNYGTLATVHKVVKMPNQSLFVFTEGTERVHLGEFTQMEPFMMASVEQVQEIEPAAGPEREALQRNVISQFQQIVTASPTLSDELQTIAMNIEEPGRLVDFIASSLPFLTTIDKQELLETPDAQARLERVNKHLAKELEVQQLRNKIQSEVQDQVQQSQRDYYLREQLKAIQKELGEADEGQKDIEELREKIEAAGMPEETKKETLKELNRLSRMSPMAADYSLTRNYIEWLAVLPWAKSSGHSVDIPKAKEILDEDHYDLKRVKDRILDYLSVRRLKADMKGPILCFVGPPGVGKTSLGRSIARALDRKFQRISLGGMHDEAELRGHRRTYIGALPGQVIQNIRRAGTNDPVLMLDEIDKLGRDFRGDPSSALLEVLDPEQNHTFRDNYLDQPFDLSKVLFICTANMLDPIPEPLRDRMEIIELQGYTEEEKRHIAFRYLIPRQVKENGIEMENIDFPEESVGYIVRHYTREAGVRKLEQLIGTVCRKQARRIAEGKTDKLVVTPEVIHEFLGGIKVRVDTEIAERTKRPGVAVGLAWTPAGGDVLFIEANRMKGKGGFTMTGQIGQVMQESMQAALTWVRSNAAGLGLEEDFTKDVDLHIHVPAGAIPKDGPSAGVTMATALASLLTNRAVRPLTAMTGEITLSGNVLPVGGIKEKFLAAKRAGVKHVILPAENKLNVEEDLTPEQIDGVEIHYASRIEDVLAVALPANGEAEAERQEILEHVS